MGKRILRKHTLSFLLFVVTCMNSLKSSATPTVAAYNGSTRKSRKHNDDTLTHLNATKVSNLLANIPKYRPSEPESVNDINVSRCLQHGGQLVFWLTSLRLDSAHWETRSRTKPMSCTLILAATGVRKFHLALWRRKRIHGSNCSTNNYVTVRDYRRGFETTDCGSNFTEYISSSNVLEIAIAVGEPSTLIGMTVSVLAMDETFVAQFIAPDMGFIHTPLNVSERPLPPDADSWMTISLPLYHVTLISFLNFSPLRMWSFGYDPASVQLYKGGYSAKNMVWEAADFDLPLPEVLDAGLVYLRYSGNVVHLRFKLLYTFHGKSRQPTRVYGGMWNCSVPEWPQFERHFRCNVHRECEGGEDEAPCVYSGYCGQNYLTIGNSPFSAGDRP